MNEKNIEVQIQKIFNNFNNKNYEIVIDECLNLIRLNYKIPILYNLLGTVFIFKKEYEKSLEYYLQGVKLDPDNEEFHRNIGKNYLFLKKYTNAEKEFLTAIKIKKTNSDSLLHLGIIYLETKNEKKAIQFLEKSLQFNPLSTESFYNLGLCHKNLGDFKKAIEYYKKAIKSNLNHLKSYNNLGVCYLAINDYKNALDILTKCLDINPEYSHALNNLGSVNLALKKYSEAEINFTNAYTLNKNLITAGIQKIFLKRKKCDWSSENEITELMCNSISIDAEVIPWQCLGMEDNPKNHLIRAKKYSNKFKLKSHNNNVYKNSKIRLGYFASDFYQHAGMINMLGIFKNHNKKNYEIIGLYYGDIKKDKMHNKIKKYFDEFYYVENLSDEQIAKFANKIRVDIAINRSGHTDKARGNIFSFRAAPIQINYLGYPGTLGQEGIDYIIADKFVIPEDKKKYYSEKIIYIDNSFYPKDNSRVISNQNYTKSDIGISENSFVFCSLNNSYKITPEEFEVWSSILKNVKNSVLVLLSNSDEMRKNIIYEASKNNIDIQCIKFVNYLEHDKHLARHKIFDLFLDSFNVNAHTSAVDSLWAGLPILTKVGNSFSSRICGSILNSLGLNNLISYSKKEYMEKAIYLGNNIDEIKKIKNLIIKSKEKNNFYDIKSYTCKLESAFAKAHELRLNNNETVSFEV